MIAQLSKKSKANQAAIEKYESRIGADQNKIASMTSKISKYSSSIAQYKKQLNTASKNNALIVMKLAQTRKLVNDLMQQRNEALSLAEKYRLSVEQKDRAVGKFEVDIRRIRARVADLDMKLQRANAVQKNLAGLLREHKVMITGLKKLLHSRPTPGEFEELDRAFKASRATIKALKANLQQYAKSGGDAHSNHETDEDSHDIDGDHHVEINIHQLQEGESALDLM